ncbi:hypothetical protein COUCH_35390 [Couchioplanes caeruleus]|uniref:hypothetical protein n=1 Tax=Couchioplanes caeruleus TaxID=56438 RepID=UPI0020C0327E|nr:hypothetical protein [Couchioplanes caeruleus]UQU64191.1 hypothetical protein COUCH_35390 [Couchioplanes caeruleus]
MSARKLGRFAGLVFVLAALIGGAAAANAEYGTAGAGAEQSVTAIQADLSWG